MNAPLRRPPRRDDLGISRLAEQLTRDAAAIEVGWTSLKTELSAVGWPERTPEGDQRERGPKTATEDDDGHNARDYADPTGEQAIRLKHMHDDREALEDHRLIIEQSVAAITKSAPPSS